MTDIVEWLRGLSNGRRKAFGEKGMAGCRFDEAADTIDRLRVQNGALQSDTRKLALRLGKLSTFQEPKSDKSETGGS